jgi:hypothetical protein
VLNHHAALVGSHIDIAQIGIHLEIQDKHRLAAGCCRAGQRPAAVARTLSALVTKNKPRPRGLGVVIEPDVDDHTDAAQMLWSTDLNSSLMSRVIFG